MEAPIIFDLGNVLLGLEFERFVRRAVEQSKRSGKELRSRYVLGESKRRFERGQIRENEFFDEMANWLDWPEQDLDRLAWYWNDVFDDVPGAAECIEQLTVTRPLWLMSDTNETHWRYVTDKWSFIEHFDRHFTSYTRGRLKSDTKAFEAVIEALSVPPSNVLFFDDIPEYVANARDAGLNAHVFVNWADVMTKAGETG